MMCQDGKAHTTCNSQHWSGTKHPVGLSDETAADKSKRGVQELRKTVMPAAFTSDADMWDFFFCQHQTQ